MLDCQEILYNWGTFNIVSHLFTLKTQWRSDNMTNSFDCPNEISMEVLVEIQQPVQKYALLGHQNLKSLNLKYSQW